MVFPLVLSPVSRSRRQRQVSVIGYSLLRALIHTISTKSLPTKEVRGGGLLGEEITNGIWNRNRTGTETGMRTRTEGGAEMVKKVTQRKSFANSYVLRCDVQLTGIWSRLLMTALFVPPRGLLHNVQ